MCGVGVLIFVGLVGISHTQLYRRCVSLLRPAEAVERLWRGKPEKRGVSCGRVHLFTSIQVPLMSPAMVSCIARISRTFHIYVGYVMRNNFLYCYLTSAVGRVGRVLGAQFVTLSSRSHCSIFGGGTGTIEIVGAAHVVHHRGISSVGFWI